jgi:hypothetical protein
VIVDEEWKEYIFNINDFELTYLVLLHKKLMKIIGYAYIVLLALLFNVEAYGQFNETIQSGRPGQAIGSNTVGANVFQMQNGFDYNNHSNGEDTYQLNDINSVFRYEFTENFEFGLGLNYYTENSEVGSFTQTAKGLSSFSIRMRSNVYVGKGLIPSVGYQFNLGLPYVSYNYKTKDLAPKITIVTSQSLTSAIGFTTNFGFNWDGNTVSPTAFYILNLGYSINDKWAVFIENYGTENNNKIDSKFDGGVAFLANNNLQLDLFGGYDQSDNNFNDWFVSVGFSWRFKIKKSSNLSSKNQ